MRGGPELSNEDIASGSTSGNSDQATYPFDSMKLKVGDRLQLQPPKQLAQDRFIVRLVGYLPNVSMLVTAPINEAGFPLQLLEDESVIIRVFSAQNAFGFSTTVARICKSPFDYLHLRFPSEVQGMIIRTAPRVKTRIIATVTRERDGDDNSSAIITNLSANGALVDASRILAEKGEAIKLAFKLNLHGFDSIVEVHAFVRAITDVEFSQQDNKAHIRHGIQFADLLPNTIMLLQSLIYQQMVEHPETVT